MSKHKSWAEVADELTRDVERERELEAEIERLEAILGANNICRHCGKKDNDPYMHDIGTEIRCETVFSNE